MLNRKIKKLAFTLAEVIIVLGIIGIVAEMTIPTLVQNTQDASLASGLLKFHAELQQAILMYKTEQGCSARVYECLSAQGLPTGTGNVSYDDFMNNIGKYFKVTKSIRRGAAAYTSLDWLANDTASYYGNWGAVNTIGVGGVSKNAYSMDGMALLADGMTLAVYGGSVGTGYYEIWIDVNGKKPPNRMGRDTFRMGIGGASNTKDIRYPWGAGAGNNTNGEGLCSIYSTCNPNNTDPTVDNGAMPVSYILINKRLPDFKALSESLGASVFKP